MYYNYTWNWCNKKKPKKQKNKAPCNGDMIIYLIK